MHFKALWRYTKAKGGVVMAGLFKREKYLGKIQSFYHDDDIIKVISGVRRCWKSCLMETFVDELRSSGVSEENMAFSCL